MSITSICITLCAVATVVTANPQGSRERLESASEDIEIKKAEARTQLALLTVDELSNLFDDEDVTFYASVFVKKYNSRTNGGEIFKEMILGLPPGYERNEARRAVMNMKVLIKILSFFNDGSEKSDAYESSKKIDVYESSKKIDAYESSKKIDAYESSKKIDVCESSKKSDFYESSDESKEVSETTLKVNQAIANGVIERLVPVPCLREFVGAMLKVGGIEEIEFSGTTCEANAMYTSPWYQRTCRDVMEGSSEEEYVVDWLCGAPTLEDGDDAEDVGSGPV